MADFKNPKFSQSHSMGGFKKDFDTYSPGMDVSGNVASATNTPPKSADPKPSNRP